MREPLPIFCATSAAYAAAAAAGLGPGARRREQEWHERLAVSSARTPSSSTSSCSAASGRFAELLEIAPRSDEAGDGWASAERSRFGRLARRLWDGLLAREEVSAR